MKSRNPTCDPTRENISLLPFFFLLRTRNFLLLSPSPSLPSIIRNTLSPLSNKPLSVFFENTLPPTLSLPGALPIASQAQNCRLRCRLQSHSLFLSLPRAPVDGILCSGPTPLPRPPARRLASAFLLTILLPLLSKFGGKCGGKCQNTQSTGKRQNRSCLLAPPTQHPHELETHGLFILLWKITMYRLFCLGL
ncbi:hypothetical protein BT93_B0819 [Corymbia citriodora subsp. variegata]|nr:hypothetical protein BT93_B0819 [Corymbia citriodora subsp. variegata]